MGKIKKILENELVGGTQSSDVYPVTSVKAVYDEENERLDNIINRRGIVNISTNYNSNHIAEVFTLSQAIAKVPLKDRVLGFQGKFLTSEGWKSYMFVGDSLSNWGDTTKWIEIILSSVLAQELGDNSLKAISQKAVTDSIKVSNKNTGISEYKKFSESKSYNTGDIVQYTDNLLYEFTTQHPAGAWIGTDVKKTSLKGSLDNKLTKLEYSTSIFQKNSKLPYSDLIEATKYIKFLIVKTSKYKKLFLQSLANTSLSGKTFKIKGENSDGQIISVIDRGLIQREEIAPNVEVLQNKNIYAVIDYNFDKIIINEASAISYEMSGLSDKIYIKNDYYNTKIEELEKVVSTIVVNKKSINIPSTFDWTLDLSEYEGYTMVIQDEFNLYKKTVNLPNNVILKFVNNGSFKLGTFICSTNIEDCPTIDVEQNIRCINTPEDIQGIFKFKNDVCYTYNIFGNPGLSATNRRDHIWKWLNRFYARTYIFNGSYTAYGSAEEWNVPSNSEIYAIDNNEVFCPANINIQDNCYIHDINLKLSSYSIVINGTNNRIDNSSLNETLINLKGEGNKITNNYFSGGLNKGITINSNQNIITHNSFIIDNSNNSKRAIVVSKGDSNIIAYNLISGGITGIICISNVSEKSFGVTNTIIKDNIINNITEEAISFDYKQGYANLTLTNYEGGKLEFTINEIDSNFNVEDFKDKYLYGIYTDNIKELLRIKEVESLENNSISVTPYVNKDYSKYVNTKFACAYLFYHNIISGNICNSGELFMKGAVINCHIINNVVKSSIYGTVNINGYVYKTPELRDAFIGNVFANNSSKSLFFNGTLNTNELIAATDEKLHYSGNAYNRIINNPTDGPNYYMNFTDSVFDTFGLKRYDNIGNLNKRPLINGKNNIRTLYLVDDSQILESEKNNIIRTRDDALIFVGSSKVSLYRGDVNPKDTAENKWVVNQNFAIE